MVTLIEKAFFKLKNIKLFILVLIGQIMLFFTIIKSITRSISLMQFLNAYNFCNYVIMTIVFIIAIYKVVNTEQIRSKFIPNFELLGAKKSMYIYKLSYILELMIFSSCITFLELLILIHKFDYMKFSYILILKQSIYSLFGYLPFLVLQFSILMLINKKGVSVASGVMGYFLGALGSTGIAMKNGILDIWGYPFFTAPIITDSTYGGSIENDMSVVLIITSIIVSAIIIFISLYFYNKEEIYISKNKLS